MANEFLRAVLFSGETPTKILTGTPEQLLANNTIAGEYRIVGNNVRTTADIGSRTSLPTDDRLIA